MNSKKTVVIHIDALRREYLSAWLLGECFKQNGFRVLLTSRHSTIRLLKYFTPDILISTHAFLLKPKEWVDLVERGTQVYINEVEGTDHEFGVSTTYPETFYDEKIDYSLFSAIFVWGDFSYDWVIKNRAVPAHRVFLNGSTRQSALSRPKRKTDNVVVGILSRFEIINTFDNRHPFVNLMALDPEEAGWRWYYERCMIDSETFSIVSKLMGMLVEKGYHISMRAHPNENLEPYKLLKEKFGEFFKIDNAYSINEWLSTVSVVVGTTSTAFTEPYLAKIPIISTSKIQNFHYSGKDQADLIRQFDQAAYTPESVREMFELCIKLDLIEKSSADLDGYFNAFYSFENPVDPIEKIVDVVKNDHIHSQTAVKINYFFANLFLYALDALFIVKNSTTNFRSIGMIKGYNYNRFFHRPSAYMMNILSGKIVKK
jgi:surface carbohydrate biosynthesis protein